MKFILFVEGETEQKVIPGFLKRWLDQQLSKKVGIQPVLFVGWSDLVKNVARRAHAYLNSPSKDEIIAVISLLDLYGPDFYPPHIATANARWTWAKADLEGKVKHEKFRQHFAVHECEAWLLSDPTLLPQEVRKRLPGKCASPETVNFDEPPKALLQKLFREKLQTTYKQVTHGVELFGELDPNLARDKCPQFRVMLDEMLALAKTAGL